ncbi:site-2 protease family protein [Larkinella humicola]|uniref:Site-2 protease family protein n=1 Tax=Larkinella humicola TaxID=2607654 RepID=A0A5N1JTI7_9BACT|nr:site-2 protease family protein [Larkinella humicola]KAA9357103.1 site-2 protease family protein [Larkinella humicola]
MNPQTRTYLIQASLFVLTLISTTAAGAEWMYGRFFLDLEHGIGWPEFWDGLHYSIPFLAILTVHEFGHFFMARYHHVRVTLPYYIPMWFGFGQTLGTLGAFIRIQDFINSRKKFFDIGIAGPLAGFVLALIVLWYGFTHLPPPEYIFSIHPDYQKYGLAFGQHVYKNLPPESAIQLGDNLLFWFFKTYVADPARLPHPYEMVHYPYLMAGYFALFFTSLNLIPIGQLDGGHVLYSLIGRRAFRMIAPVLLVGFAFYAGLGFFKPTDFVVADDRKFMNELGYLGLYIFGLFLSFQSINENRMTTLLLALSVVTGQFLVSYFFPTAEGYPGFLLFILILGRFLGVYHPETEDDQPLGTGRIVLGWLALLIFVLCFSPKPFVFS